MKFDLKAKIPASVQRFGLKVRAKSPDILVVAGVIGVGVSLVLVAKETLNTEPIMDKHHELIERIDVDSEEVKKEKTKVYLKTTGKMVKNYAPAVSIATISVGCILCAHGIMKKRNLALTAAYNGLSTAFSAYRERVVNQYGEEKDKEFSTGITYKKHTATDKKTGKKETTYEAISDSKAMSPYARLFDESNPNWTKSPETNKAFLINMQNYCNDLLNSRGYLFLNEVYKMLGIDDSREGQIVGWYKRSEQEIADGVAKQGDEFVDFGLDKRDMEHVLFNNGDERSVLMDFNVDGLILNKLH